MQAKDTIRIEAANTLSRLGFPEAAIVAFTEPRYTFTKMFRNYLDQWAYSDEERTLARYWLDICEKEEI